MRIALVALASTVLAIGASAAQPGPFPEVSFSVTLRGEYASGAICVGPSADLTKARRLTNLGLFSGGAWSPDGTRIAIAGGKPHRGSSTAPIRVENSDGTALRAVTRPRLATEDDSSPAWSPEGRRIVFSRYVFYGPRTDYRRAGLWVVDLVTHREVQLLREGAPADWSPTGDVIAAVLGTGTTAELVLVTPRGVVERRATLPFLDDFDVGASWSPDGTRLAVGGGAIVDRTGGLVGRYAPPSTNDAVSMLPSWSPDGSTIVFARAGTTYDARTNTRSLLTADLYVAPALGGVAVPLTRTPSVNETSPEWRPGTSASAAGTTQPCLVTGTAGSDVIRGTRAEDLVDGGAGNDSLDGRGGGDVLAGGAGNDSVRGGAGHDVLLGGEGNDRLEARDGAYDRLLGGSGRDFARVDGRPGRRDSVAGVERIRRR